MSILLVCAHPDDETVGMGGTLKKLSKNHEIHVLFLTDGVIDRRKLGSINLSKYDISEKISMRHRKEVKTRQDQAKRALSILGVKNMTFLDFPNAELDKVPLLKVIKSIEKVIEETKCQTIFTHHGHDIHLDHRVAFEATITAARPVPDSKVYTIFSFEIFGTTNWRQPFRFNPNMYIDISSQLRFKIKAIKQYKGELMKTPDPRSVEMIESVAKRWGGLMGFHAAEPFEIFFTRLKDTRNIFIQK